MRVGLIRVMTTSDRRLLHAHGKLLQEAFGFSVTSRCIPDQPSGVYDQVSLESAAPKVVQLAREMAGDADALIISCASDPGLAATRAAVDIPVIGAGSAAAAAALTFGGRIGVLGLGAHVPGPIADALANACCLLMARGASKRPTRSSCLPVSSTPSQRPTCWLMPAPT